MSENASAAQLLDAGCAALAVDLDGAQREQLLAYLELLQRWNSKFNLTAVRDPDDMVRRHLLDSLSIVRDLHGTALLDVGSGPGLPGIPLAVAERGRRFTLLDSNGKKTRFMFQAIAELGLRNCEVVKARVETWRAPKLFDAVLSRAFASLGDMIDTCAHLLGPEGRYLAMKGSVPEAEIALLSRPDAGADLLAVRRIDVPGLAEERCLVTLRARAAVPAESPAR